MISFRKLEVGLESWFVGYDYSSFLQRTLGLVPNLHMMDRHLQFWIAGDLIPSVPTQVSRAVCGAYAYVQTKHS